MARESAKQKAGKAPAATSVSPELPADDDEERLPDVRHMDELNCMVNRMYGLEAAILGVCDNDMPLNVGLNQLASDVARAMENCAAAFEAERQRRMTPRAT